MRRSTPTPASRALSRVRSRASARRGSGAARPTRPGAIDRGRGRALAQARAAPRSGERARMVRPRQGSRPLTLAPRMCRGEKSRVQEFCRLSGRSAMTSKTAIVVTAGPCRRAGFRRRCPRGRRRKPASGDGLARRRGAVLETRRRPDPRRRSGDDVPARPRAEGIDPRRVRHRRHSALLSRIRQRVSCLSRPARRRDGKTRLRGTAAREDACMTVALARSETALEDRWTAPEGWFYMTGMQALVRLPIQQRLRDAAAGLNTGGYISGYRGSPLGRYDIELWRAGPDPQAAQHRLPPGPERGPRRDRDLGRAARVELSRRDGRWRVRHLVRQGPGRRPLGRRAAPRQLHRRRAEGRRDRARRRRPRREIVDGGQFLRHLLRRGRHAGALPVEHPGADRLRPARHRDVALLRLLGRHEGRHRRRRGRRHGLCRPGLAHDRHPRAAEQAAGRFRRPA